MLNVLSTQIAYLVLQLLLYLLTFQQLLPQYRCLRISFFYPSLSLELLRQRLFLLRQSADLALETLDHLGSLLLLYLALNNALG